MARNAVQWPTDAALQLWRDEAVLQRLRGALPAAPVEVRAAQDRAADGDPQAARVCLHLEAEVLFADVVARALAFEGCTIALPDGSSLSLDDAERLLVRREARATHVLRHAVSAAMRPFLPQQPRHSGGDDATSAAFLLTTRAARDEAIAVLSSLGRVRIDGPLALARALDLANEDGAFAEASTLALLQAARQAAARHLKRPMKRIIVPRLCTGLALTETPEVRFGSAALTLRFARHADTLHAGLRAIAASASSPVAADALRLGLLSARTRRQVLQESASSARDNARLACAVLLLRARASAGIDGVVRRGDHGQPDACREALADAFGLDPGVDVMLQTFLQFHVYQSDERNAARNAIALRERYDEAFVLNERMWSEPDTTVQSDAGSAWAQWLAETSA